MHIWSLYDGGNRHANAPKNVWNVEECVEKIPIRLPEVDVRLLPNLNCMP